MNLAVVGCGLIGTRRALTARAAGTRVRFVVDIDRSRAETLAAEVGAEAATDWERVVGHPEVDAVNVATVNRWLMPIAVAALRAGKHVLCEKPLGRNATEALAICNAAREAGRVLQVGFNLRFHPAIAEAHTLVASGAIGELTHLRAAYGHGGRPGYESEWRARPEESGGGELLDQGIHLADLCGWFLGPITEVLGATTTSAWPIAPAEDNGFGILRTADGRVASIHTSWTQWKNLFRLEVFGTQGALTVEGLGGSYGPERLTIHRRRAEGGVPDIEVREFADDPSWERDWGEFAAAAREGREPLAGGQAGLAAARIVDALYESARTGRQASASSG